jgi:hypothetical protein
MFHTYTQTTDGKEKKKKEDFLLFGVSVDPGAKTWTTWGQLCHNP